MCSLTINKKIPKTLNPKIHGIKPSATLAINEKCHRLMAEGKKVFKLGFGQSPFPVPGEVVEALKRNASQKNYLPVKGLWELREAVSEYNFRKFQIESSPEDILVGPGSKELLYLLQVVFDGDLLIPKPSWVSYEPQGQMAGQKIFWLETSENNNWMLEAHTLETHAINYPDRPAVLILNYPSNPTGATFDENKLKQIAYVAADYGILVLADEIYGELNHTGKHLSIATHYPEGTIVSSGLSKWCGAGGWRLGTFTFPSSLRWILDAMAVAASETFTSTSSPIQFAAVRAFEGGKEIENYLEHSRMVLAILANTISQKLKDVGITHPKPKGGFYLFPNFEQFKEPLKKQEITTSEDLCHRLLDETGVALLPASDFGFSPQQLMARLSYVDFDGEIALGKIRNAPSHEILIEECAGHMMEGIDRMCEWIQWNEK